MKLITEVHARFVIHWIDIAQVDIVLVVEFGDKIRIIIERMRVVSSNYRQLGQAKITPL